MREVYVKGLHRQETEERYLGGKGDPGSSGGGHKKIE